MNVSEFLRPNKYKIILALLVPYIYAGIVILAGHAGNFISGSQISILIPLPVQYVSLVIYGLLESLVTYPFACALTIFFSRLRTKTLSELKKDRKGLLLASLSILIFNPLSLRLILLAVILIAFPVQAGLPCGVLVVDVFEDSPAYLAGLQENEIILVFDNENIRDSSWLLRLLSGHKPGDLVRIATNKGDHELELGINPETGGPFIGATFTNNYCDCGNGICEPGEQVRIENTTFTYCGKDCD